MNDSPSTFTAPAVAEPSVLFDHSNGHRAFTEALYRRLAEETAKAIKRVYHDPAVDVVVVIAPPTLQDSEEPGVRLDVGDRERNRITGQDGPLVWDYTVVNPGDSSGLIESKIRRAARRARVANKERS